MVADLVNEVDACATNSIISAAAYQRLWPQDQVPKLPANVQATLHIHIHTRKPLYVKKRVCVMVQHQSQTAKLELIFVG